MDNERRQKILDDFKRLSKSQMSFTSFASAGVVNRKITSTDIKYRGSSTMIDNLRLLRNSMEENKSEKSR